MVGNLWEWTADWQATVQTTTGLDVQQEWPSGYQGDGTFSVTSAVYGVNTASGKVTGLPAVLVRGGQGGAGDRAGVFALAANDAPSMSDSSLGFRCVIPR